MIYLKNCMTSQPAPEVIEAMTPYLKEKFWLPDNFVQHGEEIQADITRFKQVIADSIQADADEVHFTRGGTSANNLAIKGYAVANAKRGKHIICSIVDYPDILTNAAFLDENGFEVTYLPADEEAFVDLDELREAIRPDTIMFMTTLANHVTGTVQPLDKIRTILDQAPNKVALMVDAAQAYGKMPIDVNNPAVDLMTFSAHKIHGPQGIGAMYVRKGTALGQVTHGIARIDRYETGMIPVYAMAGFAKAAELAIGNLEENVAHMKRMRDRLIDKIEERIPHIMINGPRSEGRIAHNANVTFLFIEGEAIMMMLDMQGIAVQTGSACASQGLKPNYILMGIGRTHEESHGSMKMTVSRYTTEEEIDKTVDALEKVAATLRSRSPLYNA